MIDPGISQTLKRYQGNKVMAFEKNYIWIVKSKYLFSLASDQGINGIMPFEVSIIRN